MSKQELETAYDTKHPESDQPNITEQKHKLLEWMFIIESSQWAVDVADFKHWDPEVEVTYPSWTTNRNKILVRKNCFVGSQSICLFQSNQKDESNEATSKAATRLFRYFMKLSPTYPPEVKTQKQVTHFLNRIGTCIQHLLRAVKTSVYPQPLEIDVSSDKENLYVVEWNRETCKQLLSDYTAHVLPYIRPATEKEMYVPADKDVLKSIVVDLWIQSNEPQYKAYETTRQKIATAEKAAKEQAAAAEAKAKVAAEAKQKAADETDIADATA